jgi:hypothetical protein
MATTTRPVSDLAYLSRTMKAPTLARSIERLGERARAARFPARKAWKSVANGGGQRQLSDGGKRADPSGAPRHRRCVR